MDNINIDIYPEARKNRGYVMSTNKRIAYRVQHKDTGIGCYQHYDNVDTVIPDSIHDMWYEHGNFNGTHPNPYNDFGHNLQWDEYCAFANLKQLKRWFGKWLYVLRGHGFQIVKVECDIVGKGKYQVVIKNPMVLSTIPIANVVRGK